MKALPTARTDGPAVAIERLIDRLQKQRLAMLRADAGAVMEVETATREVEQALAALPAVIAEASHQSAPAHRLEPSTVERLREALQSSQQVQAMFAAGNRRALDALFGAPDLYSR